VTLRESAATCWDDLTTTYALPVVVHVLVASAAWLSQLETQLYDPPSCLMEESGFRKLIKMGEEVRPPGKPLEPSPSSIPTPLPAKLEIEIVLLIHERKGI